MRIRRKPWARPELLSCDFFIDNPKEYKGNWSSQFNKIQPLYLELGCGKGVFTAKFGAKYQNKNLLAIDIKDEVLVLAKRNIEQEYNENNLSPGNVLLTAYDIELINDILDENDLIQRIYINFCNPWPKNKHKKRRLTHPRQLSNYKNFLVNNGKIYFKTDDDNLFNESIPYFLNNNFKIEYLTRDLHNSDFRENIWSEHEKMFSDKNIKIKFLIAKCT